MVDSDGNYLCTPHSGCDCPAGQLFCSHMLGLLLPVMIIQQESGKEYSDYESMKVILPLSIESLQSMPLYWHFFFLYTVFPIQNRIQL